MWGKRQQRKGTGDPLLPSSGYQVNKNHGFFYLHFIYSYILKLCFMFTSASMQTNQSQLLRFHMDNFWFICINKVNDHNFESSR